MLMRLWRGRPRGLSELPPAIRNGYMDNDVYLGEALLSVNGLFMRLKFLNETLNFWGKGDGGWVRMSDTGPTLDQLLPVPTEPAPTVITTTCGLCGGSGTTNQGSTSTPCPACNGASTVPAASGADVIAGT
jgi:hypothetical protein